MADFVMACQQKTPTNWNIPLSGFFYTNPDSKNVFNFEHHVGAISHISSLTALCKLFPENKKYQEWYAAIELNNQLLDISVMLPPSPLPPDCVAWLNKKHMKFVGNNPSSTPKDKLFHIFNTLHYNSESKIITTSGVYLAL